MKVQPKHYFACANSAMGFQNLFASNLQGLSKIYILKGGPGNGKSTLLKRIGTYLESKDLDVEYIHCSGDSDSLDGVISRKIGFGMVDGTAPHVIEPNCAGCVEEYVNIGAGWDSKKLKKNQGEIEKILKEISKCYPKAYEEFGKAIKIHDELEKIYITSMDFKKANDLSETVIYEILKDARLKKESKVIHRFFGGSTCNGPVDYVPTIIEPVGTRYFIKGRPGSGKSTMLKKLLAKAQIRGLDVEVYHCGFDPNSLDMILLPELDTVIFDSTAPHEYYPDRETDIIVDMYGEIIADGTDEEYEEELTEIRTRYKDTVNRGISHLKNAKILHDELEGYYVRATDFTVAEKIYESMVEKIDDMIANSTESM